MAPCKRCAVEVKGEEQYGGHCLPCAVSGAAEYDHQRLLRAGALGCSVELLDLINAMGKQIKELQSVVHGLQQVTRGANR